MSTEDPAELLSRVFRPRSIAVLGASPANTFGGRTMRYLAGSSFDGRVWGVNPKYDEVRGYPCVASVSAIPEDVDLAVVAVAQPAVLPAIHELATKNCRTAIILTSGFAEKGARGAAAEAELVATARAAGMRLVGPNCNGLINAADDIPLGCSTAMEVPIRPGNVAVVAQSGSVCASIIDLATASGLGISRGVALGNGADLTAADYVDMLTADDATSVVLMFLEGVPDGIALVDALRRLRAAGKIAVVYKVGRSDAGKEMAASHTASLAGSYEVFAAFVESAGAIVVDSIEGLIATAVLVSGPLPRVDGRVQVLSLSGSLCGVIADELSANDLELAQLAPTTVALLSERFDLPEPCNPLDFAKTPVKEDSWGRFESVSTLLLEDPAVDVLLVGLGLAHTMAQVARSLIAARDHAPGKPIIVYLLGGAVAAEAEQIFREHRIPITNNLRDTVAGIAAVRRVLGRPRQVTAATEPTSPSTEASAQAALARPSEYTVATWLAAHGVDFPSLELAHSADEAVAAAARIGGRVVLKVSADQAVHKTDLGLVLLDLDSPDSITMAFETIQTRAEDAGLWDGEVLVAEQIELTGGFEMLIGVDFDAAFGHTMTLAAGGIFTEVLHDAVTIPLPRETWEVTEALGRLTVVPILRGARGTPLDEVALTATVLAVAAAVRAAPTTAVTLECNPVVVLPEGNGCIALDARLVPAGRQGMTLDEVTVDVP